jgi:hypothetical protein
MSEQKTTPKPKEIPKPSQIDPIEIRFKEPIIIRKEHTKSYGGKLCIDHTKNEEIFNAMLHVLKKVHHHFEGKRIILQPIYIPEIIDKIFSIQNLTFHIKYVFINYSKRMDAVIYINPRWEDSCKKWEPDEISVDEIKFAKEYNMNHFISEKNLRTLVNESKFSLCEPLLKPIHALMKEYLKCGILCYEAKFSAFIEGEINERNIIRKIEFIIPEFEMLIDGYQQPEFRIKICI